MRKKNYAALLLTALLMAAPTMSLYAEEPAADTQATEQSDETNELKEKLAALQEQVEALNEENEELRKQLEGNEEEPLDNRQEISKENLKNAADAYWKFMEHAKVPESVQVEWAGVYLDKDILLCIVALESDGRYYPEYVHLYHADTGEMDTIGKDMDLEEKYKLSSENTIEIDWHDVIAFSATDEYEGEPISEDTFITKEEARYLIEEYEPTPTPTPAPVEYSDRISVRLAQEALNAAGYNCGTPDGVAGANTQSAITNYQTDKGLTVTGTVTDQLLDSLGIVEKVQKAVEAEAKKDQYETGYTYDQLARNPDTYEGKLAKITGKVLQADSAGGDTYYARIAMNSDYNTVIFVTYSKGTVDYRLLEDDIISVYGTCYGVYSYEAVSGATITIPWIHADVIEMQ